MRFTLAVYLLSLITVASSLATGPQNPRRGRQSHTRASSLFPSSTGTDRAASSTSIRTSRSTDVFSEPGTKDKSRKRKLKRAVARPPLVDSALLRFLSKQKKLKEQQQNSSVAAPFNIVDENDQETQQPKDRKSFSLMDTITQTFSIPQRQQKYQNQQESQQQQQPDSSTSPDNVDSVEPSSSRIATPPADSDLPPQPDDALDSWMGQFNRNRIAKVLLSRGDKGVDEDLANQAGESVQRHVLARTARRRVREFLKARDTMWSEGVNDIQSSSAGKEISSAGSRSKEPDYGFADVLDVLIENGLTAKDVATILVHTPSIAVMMPQRPESTIEQDLLGGETIEETLQRALSSLLCDTLKLRRYDARKVLRNCPGLLTKRGSRSAQQVVAAMVKLGVSTSSMARDKTTLPALLSRPPAALFRLISFLSSDAIRMPINKIGPLIRRADCAQLLDAVAPVPRPQHGDETTTNSPPEEPSTDIPDTRILPAFVGRSVEERRKFIDETYERMSSTAWSLRNEIGTSDLGKVIAAYPSVLLLDASEQVLPVASFLVEELGIWEDDLAKVLQLYPVLLGMPISKMEAVAAFILEQGVEEENIPSIFRSFPSLLTLDIENDMMPVVDFLQSIGVNNVGRFISRLPPILGYSVERELKPKWEVLTNIYSYTSFELSKFPAFFSYPLERVIKARFEYLRDVKKLPISLIAPDLVLCYGDRDFAIKVAGDGDDGAAFSEFLKDRRQGLPGNGRNKRQRQNKKAPKQKQTAQ